VLNLTSFHQDPISKATPSNTSSRSSSSQSASTCSSLNLTISSSKVRSKPTPSSLLPLLFPEILAARHAYSVPIQRADHHAYAPHPLLSSESVVSASFTTGFLVAAPWVYAIIHAALAHRRSPLVHARQPKQMGKSRVWLYNAPQRRGEEESLKVSPARITT
jgi:hypothetical protein